MEVKPGYKQTDIGAIPEDWDIVNLGQLGHFSKGKGISKSEVTEEGIPCIRYGEIYTVHNDIITQFHSFIPEAIKNTSHKLKKGDLLFTGSGETREEIGKCVAFIDDIEAYAGGDIVILSPIEGDSRFLGYLLNYPIIVSQKASVGQGDAVVHIRAKHLSDIKIPLPPTIEEQKAIATALSETDALITNLEKLIDKKRNIKKGVMQELLILPTKEDTQRNLDKWELKTLKKLLQIPVTDGPHSTPKFLANGIPFLSVNNIVKNKVDLSDLRHISKRDHEEFSKKCKPKKGDILLGKAATVGTVAYIDFDLEFYIWSPLALIRIKKPNTQKFFFYYLQTPWLLNQIKFFTNSSSQGNIGMGDIEKLEFFVPPVDIQRKITNILTNIDSELETLKLKLAKYHDIKKGMMQELLTGKTRLV